MKHKSILLYLCLPLFLSTACVTNDRAQDIVELSGNIEDGRLLYNESCAGCHGEDGEGGTYDVSVVSATTIHRDVVLADKILEGEDEMPAFAQWTDQDIANVLAYINAL